VTVFERLGRFTYRRRWWVLAAWALLVLVAIPFAPRAPGALRAGGFSLDDLESARARTTLVQELGVPPSALVLVYEATGTARAGDPAFEAAVRGATADVATAPYVRGVASHLLAPVQVSADRRVAYDVVLLDIAPDDSPAALPGIEAALRTAPGVSVTLAGGPAFYGDIQKVSEADLRRAELVSLPLAAIALLLVFGSVIAAGVPLVIGGAAVVTALAVIFGLASVTPMSIFVLNLATLLGLGLGVDYSLLMLSRFREELARRTAPGMPADAEAVEAAVRVTVATAGRAVFFSGLTVLLGLLGLVLFEFMILRSVGIAGALVVGIAVAAALTLQPALLSVLGSRVDALAIRKVRPDPGTEGAWARLARRVMRHPLRVFVPMLALLLVLGTPFLHVRFNSPDATILPESVPSRASYETLVRNFGEGAFAPLTLAVRTTGPATDPANIARLFDYSRRLAADPRVTRVDSLVDVDPRIGLAQYQLLYASPGGPPDRFTATALAATTKGDLTAFTVTTAYGPNRDEARALVHDLRDPTSGLAPPPGVRVLVGGGAADVSDTVSRIAADFPRTGLFIVITTYLVLFLLLRSVWLPLKAIVMNTLSITAAFGALVWVFQDGNLSWLLGFQPLGFVETTLPVILFCVLFGLSMDYEVFLLTRMKEAWERTGDNTEAVAQGLERSGRIVTSAALIVVVVAGSFVFADIVLIKALGLGVALAVAIDATIVRALLVPATMRLLGTWNWWLPARLARLLRGRLPRTDAELEARLR
jgi:RND superfamily putative drug exporter